MAEGKDDIEQTHCIIPKVYVFQVPKLSTSTGYKASDWSKTPIWSGQLRVISKGDKCSILLEHTDKDGLFAACPVTSDKTVEPTTDSSRYFVLRMSDGSGRHAVIGIGFNDRTQAFDFKVSLQDWKNSNKDEGLIPSTPLEDLSIPQGGRIHVNLSGAAGKKKDKKSDERERGASGSSTASLAEAVSSLKLAEPTKTKEKKKKKSVVNTSGQLANSGTTNLFDFSGGASSSSSDPFGSSADPFATTAASSSSNDPFASMSNSTSTTSKPAKPVKQADPSDWVSF